MAKTFTLRDLPAQERPRERLVKFGEEALSSAELLALLIGRGTAGESVMALAQKLLSRFGSLKGISEASLEDLLNIKGLGLAKASQIKAAAEIARRISFEDLEKKTKLISSPKNVFNLVKEKLKDYQKEQFFVLSLDSRNAVVGLDRISVGTLNTNLVHPRETFAAAIARHAAQIIIIHNHPSGELIPSEDDLEITKQLINSGKILGIEVIDHIIVTKSGFFSFKEKGII
jgi:DNA repair protein RadC